MKHGHAPKAACQCPTPCRTRIRADTPWTRPGHAQIRVLFFLYFFPVGHAGDTLGHTWGHEEKGENGETKRGGGEEEEEELT